MPGAESGHKPSKNRGPILSWPTLPLVWIYLGYLLPREVRERRFEPSFGDLHQDYLVFLLVRRSWGSKIGMNILIAFWVFKLFMECIETMYEKGE